MDTFNTYETINGYPGLHAGQIPSISPIAVLLSVFVSTTGMTMGPSMISSSTRKKRRTRSTTILSTMFKVQVFRLPKKRQNLRWHVKPQKARVRLQMGESVEAPVR